MSRMMFSGPTHGRHKEGWREACREVLAKVLMTKIVRGGAIVQWVLGASGVHRFVNNPIFVVFVKGRD